MIYDTAKTILDAHVFANDKSNLIKKLASNPERYLGHFRPTKPRAKLIQNLLQSHEVRFGTAIEEIIRELIAEFGFTNLDRSISIDGKKNLALDQYFRKRTNYLFIEQKVRDDHDSSKKKGQIENYKAKLEFLHSKHGNNLTGIMYFLDPSFSKNRSYYQENIVELKKQFHVDLHLLYGHELLDFFGHERVWEELIGWFSEWRDDFEELPVLDLDASPTDSLEAMSRITPHYWRKIILNDQIWEDGIIRVLFSNGSTLRLLFEFFSKQPSKVYQDIAIGLLEKINRYYY